MTQVMVPPLVKIGHTVVGRRERRSVRNSWELCTMTWWSMRQRRPIHCISYCAVIITRDQNARRRNVVIIVRIRSIWRFSNPRLFPDILRRRPDSAFRLAKLRLDTLSSPDFTVRSITCAPCNPLDRICSARGDDN